MPETASGINGKTFQVITENSEFESFNLKAGQQAGTLSFTYKNTPYTVDFGIGCIATGIFPIYDLKYCASGAWLLDGTFYIKVHIIDSYVGSLHFQLSFGEDDLTIFMRKKEESLFKEFEGHLYCKAD